MMTKQFMLRIRVGDSGLIEGSDWDYLGGPIVPDEVLSECLEMIEKIHEEQKVRETKRIRLAILDELPEDARRFWSGEESLDDQLHRHSSREKHED